MKQFFFKLAGCLVLAGSLNSCSSALKANYRVIPLPQEIVSMKGKPFVLTNNVKILYPQGQDQMKRNAEMLAEYLKTATGKTFSVEAGTQAKGAIVLTLEKSGDKPEAYHLRVDEDGVKISASSEAGVFYGIQTLRKSLPVGAYARLVLPHVDIKDSPRFDYRGVHFDVGRHFFTVDEVKTFIDMMVLHNMNKMHWHLTEDQGWRLEIKKYPKLTEIGAQRKETVIGRNSGKYDGKPYGGFYTQEQAKEIVAYAAERFITVIPEIDLPGHMQAALAAYPELGCTGGPYEVWTQWGISDNVLCAGNDRAIEFVDDVLAEVIKIFPSKYIHVGGDECPKTQWQVCPKCQARIKALGLKDDDKHSKEDRLQSFVINHAEKFLNEHNRQIIGWDEILEGGLAPNATVMSWRGETGGIEAAKQHHEVIMTPNTYLYFDYYQTKDTKNEPLAIGGYLPLERVYSYEPMPKVLTPDEQKFIVGVQANHWTEYMPTFSQVMYMSLPRWAALAEIQWSAPEKKNYTDFLMRLPKLMKWYDAEKYNYAKHVFDVNVEFTPNIKNGTLDVNLSTVDNAPIHYTLDGSEPTKESPLYKEMLHLNKKADLKAVVVRASGNSRVFSEPIAFGLSTLKAITANQPINEAYKYAGITTLVDGLKGDENYRTGRWIAFNENDLDVTIDMGQPTEVSTATINVCIQKGDWVFAARDFAIEASDDGKTFTKVFSTDYPAMKQTEADGVKEFCMAFSPIKKRYFRIVVQSEKQIPEWHSGKGKAGFLFVDEIILN